MEIELKNLTKKYGNDTVVNNLSLTIPEGKVYGFIGPNGAGKTTTMRMMVGLAKANKGEILYDGKRLREIDGQWGEKIGSFISKPSYYPNLTAKENLEYIQKILKKPLTEVDRVLELVKLSEAKNKKVSQFSLGMKQRLGLAFAFLNNPEVLILDEPTNGLDPKGIFEIRELLLHFSKDLNKTVFISSHNISEIEVISDNIGIINHGIKVFEGTLESLYERKGMSYRLVTNNVIKTGELLQRQNIKYKNNGNKFEVDISKNEIYQLNKDIVRENIGLLELSPNKNLENIFLNLTR